MNKKETIVIKVGSNVITDDRGDVNRCNIKRLAAQIKKLYKFNKKILVVSSGAIACGTDKLKLDHNLRTIPEKQAAAAVGQTILMDKYTKYLHPIKVGQILISEHQLKQKDYVENLTNTINQLLKMGIVPIINENDSVAVEEIL